MCLCAGPADLFAVCRSVQDAPVLVRDWIMHPLQIVDAKEAGAAGLLGIITSVTGSGTGTVSECRCKTFSDQYSASLSTFLLHSYTG